MDWAILGCSSPGPTRDEQGDLLGRLTRPGPKRILALDGGGIRGMITIGYLERLQLLLRERHRRADLVLADYFDLMVGTSTGAIIASILATGADTGEVRRHYLDLGGRIFARQRGLGAVVGARFRAAPLEELLRSVLGDRTLGSDVPEVVTGLCVVVKRADTHSTWPLLNHPGGAFFDHNRAIPLWQAVRASAAAPTYFRPERMQVGDDEGAFVDGGVSMANNPALLALQVATLQGFPFRWPTGAESLLLVSIGTGDWSRRLPTDRVLDARRWDWATQVPSMLLRDAGIQAELLLQWLSQSPTARTIDREIGDLATDRLGPEPALSYLRYNVQLDPGAMAAIGLPALEERVEGFREMADARNRFDLAAIGTMAARHHIAADHLPTAFDLPPAG